uniref:Uncharacterized protein n=1 Tax=Parascaris equorum TaxID=6256 RepID=A0A914S3G0_PAREQ
MQYGRVYDGQEGTTLRSVPCYTGTYHSSDLAMLVVNVLCKSTSGCNSIGWMLNCGRSYKNTIAWEKLVEELESHGSTLTEEKKNYEEKLLAEAHAREEEHNRYLWEMHETASYHASAALMMRGFKVATTRITFGTA